MEACLENWNEKVTDFRRWCLRLSEKTEPGYKQKPTDDQGGKKRKKNKKKNTQDGEGQPAISLENTSMFCSLGGNQQDDDDEEPEQGEHKYSQYGPGAFAIEVPSKKNRQGQRARRAKAQAIQAKKDGKVYSSMNWREKKKPLDAEGYGEPSSSNFSQQSNSQSHGHSSNSNAANAPPRQQQQKNREEKDASSAHPSWAAKKAQKDTIVEFQGTKITF
jgi:hypothetical protein